MIKNEDEIGADIYKRITLKQKDEGTGKYRENICKRSD